MAKVTFRHLRQLKYCKPRVTEWCAQHGFNIRDFRDGIDADKIRATGCGMAKRAADLAEQDD